MESVYLETTFISYLVARPSRDLLVAAHQQVTQDWWRLRRDQFACCISQVVIDEASAGDTDEAGKRMAIAAALPALQITGTAEDLAQAIMTAGLLPEKAIRDAAHVAVAAVQTPGKRSDREKNCYGVRAARLSDAGHLHARRAYEVHRTREMLAAQFDFNLKAIFADLRQRQVALGDRLVAPGERIQGNSASDASSRSDIEDAEGSEAAPAA
jgi:hypothetical protein